MTSAKDHYLQLVRLVPQFKQIWVHGDEVIWSQQFRERTSGAIAYWPQKGVPEDRHFLDHFMADPKKPQSTSSHYKGSLAFCGKFANDTAMWFCIDGDNDRAVDAIELKLLPQLEKEGLEYIYEYSGENGDRCHVWMLFERVPISILRKYIEQQFKEAGIDIHDRNLNLELYPTHKQNNVIRLPGGLHLKTLKINAVRRMDGTEGNDAVFVIESFLNLRRLNEAEVRLRIKTDKPQPLTLRKKMLKRGPFYYNSLNLPLAYDDLPQVMRKIMSNCPAFNKLLKDAVEDDLIEARGGMNHIAGLYLYKMAIYNDVFLSKPWKKVEEGKKWAEKFFKSFRFRDYKEHNWDRDKDCTKEEAEKFIPRCETMDREFGACGGCIHKNRSGFTNPRMLYWGKPILKRMVKEMRLVSHDQIRQSTFVTVKNRVLALANAGSHRRLLLASPQGAGKSVLLDDMAVELARQGYKVLMAVHSADVALEHERRIVERGSHAFLCMSHNKHFTKNNPGFDCPDFLPIQEYAELGLGASAIKKAFCESCPFENQCPFPNQYTEVREPEHNIVIIQHAHFTSRDAMMSLIQKRFDVLMIDEGFIDKLLVNHKASELEWTLLRDLGFGWTDDLADWMEHGGYPQGKVYPKLDELQEARQYFDDHMCPWRLPEFIRAYNQEYLMDSTIGLHVFYPPPIDEIPLTVMTDATPPLEMLQIVLDDNDIELYGDDEVIDYRLMNPGNKVIQVLDGTMSKTALRGRPVLDDLGQHIPDGEGNPDYEYTKLIDILEFIGDKARSEYKDKRILITTYIAYKNIVREWLTLNYPDIMDRVLISHMKVGTNEFDQYEVQFLLAGVYLNAKQFHKQVYELKVIANHWNQIRNRPLIDAFHWFDIGDSADLERKPEKVRRIHALGSACGVFEYDDFNYRRPEDYYYNLVEKYAIAKTQQAIRLRFNDSKLKIIYVFGRFFLPSFLVTDTVLEEELLGYLYQQDS